MHRRRCTPMPIPQEAIDSVEYITAQQQSIEGIIFIRRDGSSYEVIAVNNMSIQSESVDEEKQEWVKRTRETWK